MGARETSNRWLPEGVANASEVVRARLPFEPASHTSDAEQKASPLGAVLDTRFELRNESGFAHPLMGLGDRAAEAAIPAYDEEIPSGEVEDPARLGAVDVSLESSR